MKKGFTLIELMVVISIIGLLLAIILPDLLKTREEASVQSALASLRGVQSALELYYTRYKSYPQELKILIREGYLTEGSDVDPWQRPFYYKAIFKGGEAGSKEATAYNYLLCSNGPDGVQGTADDIDPPINPAMHSPRKQAAAEAGG